MRDIERVFCEWGKCESINVGRGVGEEKIIASMIAARPLYDGRLACHFTIGTRQEARTRVVLSHASVDK